MNQSTGGILLKPRDPVEVPEGRGSSADGAAAGYREHRGFSRRGSGAGRAMRRRGPARANFGWGAMAAAQPPARPGTPPRLTPPPLPSRHLGGRWRAVTNRTARPARPGEPPRTAHTGRVPPPRPGLTRPQLQPAPSAATCAPADRYAPRSRRKGRAGRPPARPALPSPSPPPPPAGWRPLGARRPLLTPPPPHTLPPQRPPRAQQRPPASRTASRAVSCPCLLPAVPGAVGGAVPGARLPSGAHREGCLPPRPLPAASPAARPPHPARRRPRRSPPVPVPAPWPRPAPPAPQRRAGLRHVTAPRAPIGWGCRAT